MTTIWVNFSDDTDTAVIGTFAGEQDPAVYPNQANIDTGDARYVAYYNSLGPTLQFMLPVPPGWTPPAEPA